MVRVRFAPSPTGFLHLGSLRTALYDFLFAKKNNGKFILRIEDTDLQRKIPGALESLIKMLNQMGVVYDEGVFFDEKISGKIIEKGDYGPYIQSRRLAIYQEFALQLVNQGDAYYCFCSKEELEQSRKKQIADGKAAAYDRRCRKLIQEEVEKKLKQKTPHVIRLKVPETGKIEFNDLIRKKVEFDLKNIDDQVLLKSDGYPTYHLAVVVDDHLMKITHVIRGEEWLPSVPKHILIYQAFGWSLPFFAHLPLILNPDRSKLSKRQGDVTVEDYLAQGYLPEALINFIALLGWSPQGQFAVRLSSSSTSSDENASNDQEIFSLVDLIKNFSIEKIQKAGAVFNREKLDWMNGCYIRRMEIDGLTKRCVPYLIQANLIEQISDSGFKIVDTKEEIDFNWLRKIIRLEQERMKRFADLPAAVDFFFKEKIQYDSQLLIWKKSTNQTIKSNLMLVKEKLSQIDNFQVINIQEVLEKIAENYGNGEVFWPIRIAISGRKNSPPPAEIAEILGRKITIERINLAIDKLL